MENIIIWTPKIPKIFAGVYQKSKIFACGAITRRNLASWPSKISLFLEFQGPSPQIPDIPDQKSKFKVKNT